MRPAGGPAYWRVDTSIGRGLDAGSADQPASPACNVAADVAADAESGVRNRGSVDVRAPGPGERGAEIGTGAEADCDCAAAVHVNRIGTDLCMGLLVDAHAVRTVAADRISRDMRRRGTRDINASSRIPFDDVA